jgi:regulator of sigma E protease
MEVFIKIVQFLLSLSVLIIIHELGHFLAARYFNTRVEKFYLFFNPWFSIFKKKIGDTEYGLGWLPLGGYVKISGMIDESMDKEQMKQPPQPWEFRSKPAWQRLIIMLGGVTFNLILAVVIYIFMLSIIGERYLPNKNLEYGIEAGELAREIGLKSGDKIVYINGREIEDFFDIPREFILGTASNVTVERENELINLNIPTDFFATLIANRGANFISPRIPFIVGGLVEGSVAASAGVEPGDHIIGISEERTWSFDEFRSLIPEYKNQQTQLHLIREGEEISLNITIPETALIGVYLEPMDNIFEFASHNYSFLEAIPAGAVKAYETTTNYLQELRLLFKPEIKASESIGGFITIGSIFAPTWDWVHFWTITAFLSIILAIMNILPIPALDGGHVMFLFYEIIVGRKPSDRFMEYAQTVGMVLLLGLILFANFNDVMRLFR